MSTTYSPSIVTDGLVMHYDMNNTQKSWLGAPTTNLLTYSQDFSNAAWNGNLFGNWVNSVITANTVVAPDGTLTADTLTGNYAKFTTSITATTNTSYTFSCWLKNVALANPVLLHIAFGLNGTLVSYNNITTVSIASIQNWTRFSVTVTSPASGINQIQCGIDFGASKASGGTFAVAAWGAQLEANSFATPYVAASNLLTYSESPSTVYNLSAGSFVTDAIASPTGSLTADRINLTAGAMNSWDVYRQVVLPSGIVYTFSMYVLLGTASNFCVVVNNTQAWDTVARKCFTAAAGLSNAAWTRISLTFTGPAFGSINIHLGANYESALSSTPQSGGYAYMWGTQLEVGSVATAYMPTTATATSRSTTGAIMDLTGKNIITTNSLTYASDNTFSFNGTSDNITVAQTLSTPITICGFMKYTDQAKTACTYLNSYPHAVLGISLNRSGGGQLVIYIGNGTSWLGSPSITSSVNMTVNVWYYLTFVSNGPTSDLYLNGVNVGTVGHGPSGWGNYFAMGMIVQTPEYFKGNIATTQIYNRALSVTEINRNFNAQRSRYGI